MGDCSEKNFPANAINSCSNLCIIVCPNYLIQNSMEPCLWHPSFQTIAIYFLLLAGLTIMQIESIHLTTCFALYSSSGSNYGKQQ